VVVIHPTRKLARVQKIDGDSDGPLTIRLEPLGSLSGRVLGADGRPRAGARVEARMTYRLTDYKDLPFDLMFDYRSWQKHTNQQTTTDKDGRFRLNDLIPGLKYQLVVTEDGKTRPLLTTDAPELVTGKVKDVDDLKTP
jgi:hypothetical protein